MSPPTTSMATCGRRTPPSAAQPSTGLSASFAKPTSRPRLT
ncbi:hypothetical protein GBAR_LOCUS13132 [Geodia barretti]|uniref:Uncharacterized protein n=1 Tax=Geodia barretti TaxID=519541 RepID=A0AA35S2P5_GEOBA|nr:hypothetical protein GBAR_LOCUS13132 [Geodia barretti]